MYIAASEKMWASILTHSKKEDLLEPVQQQTHEPLAFLGSKFKETKRLWTNYENEGYTVAQIFDRQAYVYWKARQTDVFKDYRYLLYVFD